MKTSFFKEYYRNRLKNLRAFFIASIVLNLLAGALQFIVLAIGNSFIRDGYSFDMTMLSVLCTLMYTIPVVTVFSLFVPIQSRKYLLRKDYADTFNALPVTYKERYWGDLLAELTAFISPMIVCAVITICCSVILSGRDVTSEADFYKALPQITTSLEISFIISCVTGIALSGFMTQCFGNAKSAITYSVLTAAAIPATIMCYGKAFSGYALGVNGDLSLTSVCASIPPFGFLVNFFTNFFSYELDSNLILKSTFSPINSIRETLISILIISAVIVVGYFIGKKRKTELTGNNMIFRVTSTVISITVAVLTLGVNLDCVNDDKFSSRIVGILLTTLVMYFAFELLNKRKSIKIVPSLIGYVAVCGIGLGLYGIANATNCFGAEDYIPKANEISEVKIRNYDIDAIGSCYYDDIISISAITENHAKLLEQKDMLRNGDTLNITYVTKNGTSINRSYTANDTKILDDFTMTVAKLPQSGNGRFSILKNENIDVDFKVFLNKETSKSVKTEKVAEFKKILAEDIFANLSKTSDKVNTIMVAATYYENGKRNRIFYSIPPEYANTITFLNNPDNLTDSEIELDLSNDEMLYILYEFEGGIMEVYFNSENPVPDELYSLFTADITDSSEYFTIIFNGTQKDLAYISKADEERAKDIIFNLFRESLSHTGT